MPIPRLRPIAIVIALLASISAPADADVTILHADRGDSPGQTAALLRFSLSGTIAEADVTQLTNSVARLKKLTTKDIVLDGRLNSPGGNVSSALRLGRLLRAHNAIAQVEDGAICGSACVFVLAGAAARIVVGPVLIHRPFEPNDQLATPAEQKEKYARLRVEVNAFLDEVNVPASLYDDMLRTSPDDATALTEGELKRYGLSGNDPYYDEASDVKLAKRLGISRQEYARRKARAREVCDSMDLPEDLGAPQWKEWAKCHNKIMGIK